MIFCGIDPGTSGAIACISPSGASVADMPTINVGGGGITKRKIDPRGLAETLRRLVPADEDCLLILEDVHAMPSSASGSAANTSLMHSKGVIEGVAGTLRLRVELVNTRRWKGLFGLKADKGEALALARRLYPALQADLKLAKHHNRADAVLLAHWGLVEAA